MRFRILLPLLVLAAACAPHPLPPGPAAGPIPVATVPSVGEAWAAALRIDADSALARVAFLASDELLGRDTPSPGLEQAAMYIADRFREWGVEPAGEDGYFQRWPYRSIRFDREELQVELHGPAGARPLRFGQDYFLAAGPGRTLSGDLWFAGLASAQPRPLPAEAAGRIVVFYAPGTLDAAWQQPIGMALQAAGMRGAAGVVFVLDPDFTLEQVGQIAPALAGQEGMPVTVVGIRHEVAAPLFAAAGIDLDAVRQAPAPAAVELRPVEGVRIDARYAVVASESTPPNVIGLIRGSDPVQRDEFVVFTAHFDHVGIGPPDETGDSIYNGADDNASGTTAVLELARAFAAMEQPPARSLLFVLVSGEEKGLLGSAHFVEHPTVPLDGMIANINLDMVGRNAPDTVYAIGKAYSSLGPLAVDVAARFPDLGLTVAPDPMPEEQLFFRSDHFNFAAREIPSLFLTTGLHEDYHRPSDTVDRIDADKIARIARLVFMMGHAIATAPAVPEWTAEGLRDIRAITGGGR
jgi:Zn-dependent M28 family amino/carboxypeptidase